MPDTHGQEDRKELYEQELETRLRQAATRLKRLKARAEQANARARIIYNDVIGELWDRHLHLRLKVDGIKRIGNDVWQEMRGGIDTAWHQFKSALEKASDRIR